MKRTGMTAITAAAAIALCTASSSRAQDRIVQFGTSESESISDLLYDGSGGVWGAGWSRGSLGGPLVGTTDAVLVRYDANGQRMWSRQFGTGAPDSARAIATDMAGGAFVAGNTEGDLGATLMGSQDQYLARYDSAGNQLWIRHIAYRGHNHTGDVVSDGAGGAIVVGTNDPGGSQWLDRDIVVTRFDADGNQLWYQKFGTLEHDAAYAAAPDGQGGVFVIGETYGDLSGPSLGYYDAFVARVDGEGDIMWIRQFGTSGTDDAKAAARDGAGGVFVGGTTFKSFAGPHIGREDIYIARFDAAGSMIWARQFGTSVADEAIALDADGQGGAILAGYTWGNLSGWNRGGSDVYVARFNAAGDRLWIRQFGTQEDERGRGVASEGGNISFVSGWTKGNMGAAPAGHSDAFIARFENAPCYADCDESTGFHVLDIFDFLCFQNDFVAGDPNGYACGCSEPGMPACDIFDFLCFQQAFVEGCD